MRRFGRGYRPDPPHQRTQRSSRALFGLAPEVPESFTAEHLEAPIFDQNDCGSCFGHGTSQGLVVAFAYAHQPLGFIPSPGDIYAVTRAIDRSRMAVVGKPLPVLEDVGSYPSDGMRGLAEWGVRPMHAPSPRGYYTDVDRSNVQSEPTLADLEEDGQKIVTGQYRIDERATDFVDQLCAALVHCGACGIGVFVDTAFENYTRARGPLDDVDLNLQDPDGGGHWLAVTSYYTLEDGTRVFRGPNSWTEAWGDRGHYEVTERWLRSACSDAYVFDVDAPPEGQAA